MYQFKFLYLQFCFVNIVNMMILLIYYERYGFFPV